MAKQPEPAKPEVDITPTDAKKYPGTWPCTIPAPRHYPFSKHAKLSTKMRVLILPGRIEYDPAMADIEAEVSGLARKNDVTLVAHDYYRGACEIMARRLGLDYMVINVDNDDGKTLPTTVARDILNTSVSARRRVLSKSDLVLAVTDSPFLAALSKTNAKRKSPLTIKTFRAKYHDYIDAKVNAVPTTTPKKKRKKKS